MQTRARIALPYRTACNGNAFAVLNAYNWNDTPPPARAYPLSPPIYIGNAPSHTHAQAFITEMTDIAQMKWLDEYKTSSDKKALVAKVRLLPITQNVLQQ